MIEYNQETQYVIEVDGVLVVKDLDNDDSQVVEYEQGEFFERGKWVDGSNKKDELKVLKRRQEETENALIFLMELNMMGGI